MDDEFRKDLKCAVWAALTVVLAVVAAIGWSYNEAYVLLIFLALITGFAARDRTAIVDLDQPSEN